ncbi:VOC family protein [Paenibacillus pinihumi]|uniref:VOC family protein n=1 Tax=Paenibacillus pinihumi TaxID=669462 RepID=UPI0004082846|nr:VOC family protein [Paenibacillus pinihumi]
MYTTNKKQGIHHVCLKTKDITGTVKFYMEGLGARFVVEWGKDGADDHAVLVDVGDGDFLEIFETKEQHSDGIWQHLAIRTADIEESVRRAAEAGAKTLGSPRDADIPARSGEIVSMRFCFMRAPGGELIEFIQDKN